MRISFKYYHKNSQAYQPKIQTEIFSSSMNSPTKIGWAIFIKQEKSFVFIS